jgi:hypothetical protein
MYTNSFFGLPHTQELTKNSIITMSYGHPWPPPSRWTMPVYGIGMWATVQDGVDHTRQHMTSTRIGKLLL